MRTTNRLRAFSLVELIVCIAVIALFLRLVVPQYNAYRARFVLRNVAKRLKSDIGRVEGIARKNSSGAILPSAISNALVALDSTSTVLFTDKFPPNIVTVLTPRFAGRAGPGCLGAAAIQFPDRTGIIFSPQGSILGCDGNPLAAATIQTISLSDNQRNTAMLTIDTRTGSVTGP